MLLKSHFLRNPLSLHHHHLLQWRMNSPNNARLLSRPRTFSRSPLLLRHHRASLLPPPPPLHRRLPFPPPPLPRPFRRHIRFLYSNMSPLNSSQGESNQASAEPKTVRMVIKGRVQGVFYRNWTIETAKELGLKGWVRNRRDGSVEALFSGNPDKVQEMEQRCRRGPPDAMVTGIQVFPSTDDPGTTFERKQAV